MSQEKPARLTAAEKLAKSGGGTAQQAEVYEALKHGNDGAGRGDRGDDGRQRDGQRIQSLTQDVGVEGKETDRRRTEQ